MSAEQIDPTELAITRIHDEIVDLMAAVQLATSTTEALALVVMIRTAIEGLARVENAALARANVLPPSRVDQSLSH